MKTRLLIINLVCILGTLWAQEKTFYLKSGDKVTGTITAETDSTYGIETTFGSVTINKKNVKPEEAIVYLKSGDKLKGTILSEDETIIKLNAFVDFSGQDR